MRSTDGSDADNGSTWALAKATLVGALAAAAAGDTIYVSQVHAETQASNMTLTSPGTAANPVNVICVDDSAQPPTAYATSATVTTTSTGAIAFGAGFARYRGITFAAGSGASGGSLTVFSGASGWLQFDHCQLSLANNSNNSATFAVGTNTGGSISSGVVELVATTFAFGSANQRVNIRNASVTWRNTPSAVTGTIPTTFAFTIGGTVSAWDIQGVDLSAFGSGKNLFDVSGSQALATIRLSDCKLGASVAITTGAITGQNGPVVTLINCDSADTIYRSFRQDYRATEQQETTIVRAGGASDRTTSVSRKIVTTANARPASYYRSLPILFFNTNTGSQTISIPVLTDNVTLQDADAWLEVEYLGTSGNPLGVFADDRVSNPDFGSPANQASDSASSWTTTGLTTPVKQTLDVTVTAAKAGLMRAYVCVAKASLTLYWDPRALSASGRQYVSEAGMVNEGPRGGGPIIGSAIVRAA